MDKAVRVHCPRRGSPSSAFSSRLQSHFCVWSRELPRRKLSTFYGEYKLVLSAIAAAIECENEFAGGKSPSSRRSRSATQPSGGADDLLAGIEEHYTTIKENLHHQRLKVQVVRMAGAGFVELTLPSQPTPRTIANDGELRRLGTHLHEETTRNDCCGTAAPSQSLILVCASGTPRSR